MLSESELFEGGGRRREPNGLLHLYHPGGPVQAHSRGPATAQSPSTGIYSPYSYHFPKTTARKPDMELEQVTVAEVATNLFQCLLQTDMFSVQFLTASVPSHKACGPLK